MSIDSAVPKLTRPMPDEAYTKICKKILSSHEYPECKTLDQFLRHVVLPEVTRLREAQDKREVINVAFCWAKKHGVIRTLVIWRELPA